MGDSSPDSLLRTVKFILLFVSVLIAVYPSAAVAEEAGTNEEKPAEQLPGLAELMPMASSLYGRLSSLQKLIIDLPDPYGLERAFSAIDSSLGIPAGEIESLRAKGRFPYSRLLEIKAEIDQLAAGLEETGEPLRDSIRLMDRLRDEWLMEKSRWELWQSALEEDLEIERVRTTFEEVSGTIENALAIIHSKLVPMLEVQGHAGRVSERIIGLSGELDAMLERSRHGGLIGSTPSMMTSEYLRKLGRASGEALRNLLGGFSWPRGNLLARHGLAVAIQIMISLVLFGMLHRNRRKLKVAERWRFLAERPVSGGFFFVSIAAMILYAYSGAPGLLKLANMVVSSITFIRLSSVFMDKPWKRGACVWIMAVWIINSAFDIFWVPFPLFRIYAVLVSLAGSLMCLRWAAEGRRAGASPLPVNLLRVCSMFLAFILVAEIRGSGSLPTYLLGSFVMSLAVVLIFTLFLYIIHGGIEWLFRRGSTWQTSLLKGVDTDSLIRRTTYFIDFAVYGLVLVPGILMMWGAYDSLGEATDGLLSLGFEIGSKRFSIGLLIVAVAILYGTFFISWAIRRSLMETLLAKYSTERGVRLSIARLIHYLIVFIGFLIIISVLGVDITKLTIMISALGVGIGFGLQGIVNNFVSGLILLFERPVRVGDYIEIGGKWVEVKRIGIRSTNVYTFDKTDMIIPNADLITNQVINWTLSSRLARIIINVGVAYGSDVELVMKKLLECAEANEQVSGSPPPRVLFLSFGSVSLEFELWVYVQDAGARLAVRSELHQEIDRAFREAGIEIAFPQLDLHLRSVDEGAVVKVRGNGEETPTKD
jgi:small-conductance mechanosensitive channel